MNKKPLYIYGFILVMIIIIIIIISCILYIKTTEDDLSRLHIAISERDMKTAEDILQKYNGNNKFMIEAEKNIIEITDEEIISLSDDNVNHLLKILDYLKPVVYTNETARLTNMYNRINTYITIKNIDDKVNDYGYIEIDKYLKNFIYDSNSIVSNIAITKRKEIKNGVINETIVKAKECIENENFDKALDLLSYCSSWGNEEINQLYANVKNKVPQNNDKKNTNNTISIGMYQSEVLKICGEPNNTSKKGNAKDKNKGIFGTYDEFWHYSIPKSNKYLKFGVYFLKGKVVGIFATDPDTKLTNPVSVLSVN